MWLIHKTGRGRAKKILRISLKKTSQKLTFLWIQCVYNTENSDSHLKDLRMKTKHQRLYVTVYSLAGYDSLAIISLHGSVSGTHYRNSCNTRLNYSRQQDAARNFSTSAFLRRCLVFFFPSQFNHTYTNDWLRNCKTPFYNMNNISLSL